MNKADNLQALRTETKGGRRLRGLSRNQFCVCSATDGKRRSLVLCGAGKPSGRKDSMYSKLVSGEKQESPAT